MSNDSFTVVEVLIGRMESNPDEFMYGGRLRYIAEAIHEAALSPKLESERLWFLKDAERVKLVAAYRDFCRMRFQEELFTRLFGEKVEPIQAELTPLGNLMEKQKMLLQQEYETRMARQQSMPIPTTTPINKRIYFDTSGNERARIDASGDFILGGLK